ncbi:hypothetical protein [Dysgonomonas sp. 520]|uniref:hypothetical protein n=1 Tax=Dysgonomonas sp. 520 TaxID=2302931 RepID=UPI0013D3B8BA|nr:hypothetical protein [Dysgonomonas sp. 520]NDW10929.1 hypothetical protein [Dysgonomonas sp. 520]
MSDFARFYALLKQMPHADKEELVFVYSDSKTTSLREFLRMDAIGFSKMVSDMQHQVDELKQNEEKPQENEVVKRRFRSLILRAMQDQGVTVKNGDWSDVNNFVERYAGAGKRLSKMTLDELKIFNSQVHKLLDWHKAQIEKRARIALMN